MAGERRLTRWVRAIVGIAASLVLAPTVAFANTLAEPSVRPSDLEGAEFFLSLFGCTAAIVAGGLFLLFFMARSSGSDASERRSKNTDVR